MPGQIPRGLCLDSCAELGEEVVEDSVPPPTSPTFVFPNSPMVSDADQTPLVLPRREREDPQLLPEAALTNVTSGELSSTPATTYAPISSSDSTPSSSSEEGVSDHATSAPVSSVDDALLRPLRALTLKSQRVVSSSSSVENSTPSPASLSDVFTHTASTVPRSLTMAAVDRLSQCSRFFHTQTIPEKLRCKETLEKDLSRATEAMAELARSWTNWNFTRRNLRPELNGSRQQLVAEQDAEQKVRAALTALLAVRDGLMDFADQASAADNRKVFLNIFGVFREGIYVVLEHAPVNVQDGWSLPGIARGDHLPLAVVTNALTELGLIWYGGGKSEGKNPVVVEMLRVLKKPLDRLAPLDPNSTTRTSSTPRFGIPPGPGNGDEQLMNEELVVAEEHDFLPPPPPGTPRRRREQQDEENETVVEGFLSTLVLSHIAAPATAPHPAWEHDPTRHQRRHAVAHAGSAVLEASADLLTQNMDDLSARMAMFVHVHDLDPQERLATMQFRLYVSAFLQFAHNVLVTIGNLLPAVGTTGISGKAETCLVRLYAGIVGGTWSAAMAPAAVAFPAEVAALEGEAVRGAVLGLGLVARSPVNVKLTVRVLTERLVSGLEKIVAQVARAEQWLRDWREGQREQEREARARARQERGSEDGDHLGEEGEGQDQHAPAQSSRRRVAAFRHWERDAEADFIAEATFTLQNFLSGGELPLIVQILNDLVRSRVRDFSVRTLIMEAVSRVILCATTGPWKLESVGLISVFFSSTVVLDGLALIDAVQQALMDDVRLRMVIMEDERPRLFDEEHPTSVRHRARREAVVSPRDFSAGEDGELPRSSSAPPLATRSFVTSAPANELLDGVSELRLHDTARMLQIILQELPPGETTPHMRTIAAASLVTLGQLLSAHAGVQRPSSEQAFAGTGYHDVDGSVLASAVLLEELDDNMLLETNREMGDLPPSAPRTVVPRTAHIHAESLKLFFKNSLSALIFTMQETQHEASEERTWPQADNYGPMHHARHERRTARLAVVRALVSLLENFLTTSDHDHEGRAAMLQPVLAALRTAILSVSYNSWTLRWGGDDDHGAEHDVRIGVPSDQGLVFPAPELQNEAVDEQEAPAYDEEDAHSSSSYAESVNSWDSDRSSEDDLTTAAPSESEELRAKAVEGLIVIAKAVAGEIQGGNGGAGGRGGSTWSGGETDQKDILAEILDIAVQARESNADSTLVELGLKQLMEVML